MATAVAGQGDALPNSTSSAQLSARSNSRPNTRGSIAASMKSLGGGSGGGGGQSQHVSRAASVASNLSALSAMPTDLLQPVVQHIPPLTELCVRVLAQNFEQMPSFEGLPPKFAARVAALLPITMPLDIAARPIVDEDYWRRRSVDRWRNCQVKGHGDSWKRLFFEKHFQEALESFDDSEPALEELSRLMNLMWESVYTIHVKQLPSHIDMGIVFNGCPYLGELSLTYGVKSIGMDYRRDLFGMRPNDAQCLARALGQSRHISKLVLSDNQITDETCRMLAVGLLANYTLRYLDLSHNRIDDRGARALAKVLGSDQCTIETLTLCDNRIHEGGAQALGKALRKNKILQTLDLRLNRLGDAGGAALLQGLLSNESLTSLNLGSNSLDMDSATSLADVVRTNTTMTMIDLSCNDIPAEGGELLLEALEQNTSLQSIDLRMNKLDTESERAIQATRAQPIHLG